MKDGIHCLLAKINYRKVKVTIGNEEVTSILDTGCKLCLMSQDLYNKLWDNGMRNLKLPVQNMKLVSAFNDRARKVITQALLTFKFREVRVDQIFLIASRLMTHVLIGVDFCVSNKVTISFPDKCFTMDVNNEVTKHMLLQGTDDLASSVGSRRARRGRTGFRHVAEGRHGRFPKGALVVHQG
jgi:hypothetical protein